MSSALRLPSLACTLGASALILFSSCQCDRAPGPDAKKTDGTQAAKPTFSLTKLGYDTALAGLPKAKVDHPIEALPGNLPWLAFSDDAEAWRRFAESRAFYQRMKETPLAEDLSMLGPWVAVESLRYQVARVSSFAGGAADSDALFRGPIAVGALELDAKRPSLVVIKKVDPKVQVLVRFAAAFASLADDSAADTDDPEAQKHRPKVESAKVAGIDVRTVRRRGEEVSFSLFKDLLIVGNSRTLVERATAMAAGEPMPMPRGDLKVDLAASKEARGLLPKPGTPGLHVAHRLSSAHLLRALGVEALAASLTLDAKAPLVLRTKGGEKPGPGALSLLGYAPSTAMLALLDGRPPDRHLLENMRARVYGAGAKGRAFRVAGVDLTEALAAKLEPGVALFLGARDPESAPAALGAVLAFRHKDKAALEPGVRELLEAATGAKAERVILEPLGGALLLRTAPGPAAALTDDALLLSLSEDELRTCLAAGAGQAPSLKDRGIDLSGTAGQALFVDLGRGGTYLYAFYKQALSSDDVKLWAEAEPVLAPTFAALASGGSLFGRLEDKGDGLFEGALRALP